MEERNYLNAGAWARLASLLGSLVVACAGEVVPPGSMEPSASAMPPAPFPAPPPIPVAPPAPFPGSPSIPIAPAPWPLGPPPPPPAPAPGSPPVGASLTLQGMCYEIDACNAGVRDTVARLGQPRSPPGNAAAHECRFLSNVNGLTGSYCDCTFEGGLRRSLGPASPALCQARAHTGACLSWYQSNFGGCRVGDAATCLGPCQGLGQQLALEAARIHDARLVQVEWHGSCRSVIEVDGRCFANGDRDPGRAYDCALGADEIVRRYHATYEPPWTPPPPQAPLLARASGRVELKVWTTWDGTSGQDVALPRTRVTASAEFHSELTRRTDDWRLQPLPPAALAQDRCEVVQGEAPPRLGPRCRHSVDRIVLVDAGRQHLFDTQAAPMHEGVPLAPYSLELHAVQPRNGALYELKAEGGDLAAPVSLRLPPLPDAISVPALQGGRPIERTDLRLIWTGRGQAPLALSIAVYTPASGLPERELRCTLNDDGEHVIPSSLMQRLPAGRAIVQLSRQHLAVVEAGGRRLLTQSSVESHSSFPLGPPP
ncbi:MAG: hypothetical protein MJD61_03750 [Proteobacteria bacterium]|nr:hypothetical protein [Pseudomonadota bacterium]